jgi:hypothetical protein
MKNKLLTTTAIAGLLVSGAAFAQTTVTGNLELTYKGFSNKTTQIGSGRGLGKETQINITNKGKLNNGMDYVAGFSIEHDGAESGSQANATTSGTAMFNENVYIDFISGKTTLTIGADHIQNPDYEITNLVGAGDLDEIISGVNAGSSAFITNIGSPYSSFGVGLTQDLGVGKFSVYYAPSQAAIAGDSAGGFGSHSSYVDGSNSTYEIGFRGDLGVKGLDAGLFYNSTDSNDRATNTNSADNYKASLRYTAGAVTVAGAYAEQETNTTSVVTTKKSKSVGVAFAASKDLSLGIAHGRTDSGVAATSTLDEKITTVSVGYSLGPVGLGVSVGKVDNYGNAAIDGKTAMINLKTNF